MKCILFALTVLVSSALVASGQLPGTEFTYQGHLKRSGSGYNGSCNFQFSVWDAATGGMERGPTLNIPAGVVNGLFTVQLNFGNAFDGGRRWLQIAVQCSGEPAYTTLEPRQPLTATPYALGLRPGAISSGAVSGGPGLYIANFGLGAGVVAEGQSFGVKGSSSSNGLAGVHGSTTNANGSGVYGEATGINAAGVFGLNSSGPGIWGRSTGGGSAVYGENTGAGRAGSFDGPVHVEGAFTAQVSGPSRSAVRATASGENSAGVLGVNSDGAALWGYSTGGGSAIYAENLSGGRAGSFLGPVHVQGNLTKSSGSFKIDHPLDPANKFLSHSFVESPDMMNIYNGNVTTDANGSATVALPAYFSALNREFRYQLTVIGQFAQAIVSRKIADNSFEIRTDKPGVEVSWQVTGVRQDPYAEANRIAPEELKPPGEQGLYLYPAGYGASDEKRLGRLVSPALEEN